jgi:uncharacterized lipoprotein
MLRAKFTILIIYCLLLTGCAVAIFAAGTAAGIAGYKYYKGTLVVIYEAPFTETWNAALEALARMNISIESSDYDLTSGNIEAKRSDNKPVSISVKYKSTNETEVVIRVGYIGEKEASESIKEWIRKVLFEE